MRVGLLLVVVFALPACTAGQYRRGAGLVGAAGAASSWLPEPIATVVRTASDLGQRTEMALAELEAKKTEEGTQDENLGFGELLGVAGTVLAGIFAGKKTLDHSTSKQENMIQGLEQKQLMASAESHQRTLLMQIERDKKYKKVTEDLMFSDLVHRQTGNTAPAPVQYYAAPAPAAGVPPALPSAPTQAAPPPASPSPFRVEPVAQPV